MGQIRWYKRDPRAALIGMMELTLEERGAYNTILDLIYSNDGAVDDNSAVIASSMGVDVRVWNRIRRRLLSLQKLYTAYGQLRNERADQEVPKALHRLSCSSEAGTASAISKGFQIKKNKHLAEATVSTGVELSTTRKKERSSSSINSEAETPTKTPNSAAPATALLDGAPAPISEPSQGSKKVAGEKETKNGAPLYSEFLAQNNRNWIEQINRKEVISDAKEPRIHVGFRQRLT